MPEETHIFTYIITQAFNFPREATGTRFPTSQVWSRRSLDYSKLHERLRADVLTSTGQYSTSSGSSENMTDGINT